MWQRPKQKSTSFNPKKHGLCNFNSFKCKKQTFPLSCKPHQPNQKKNAPTIQHNENMFFRFHSVENPTRSLRKTTNDIASTTPGVRPTCLRIKGTDLKSSWWTVWRSNRWRKKNGWKKGVFSSKMYIICIYIYIHVSFYMYNKYVYIYIHILKSMGTHNLHV